MKRAIILLVLVVVAAFAFAQSSQSPNGRVTIHVPRQPLHLGEENAFDIDLIGPALRVLGVSQSQPDAQGNFVLMSGDKGQEPEVKRRGDSSTYVNVVPMGLGTVQFTFMAVYVDGYAEQVDVTGQVVAARPARSLVLQQAFTSAAGRPKVSMTVGLQKVLGLAAEFEGVPQPLNVPAKDVRFKVRQTSGAPTIRFDPATGTIDSLRIGDALIESTYAGVKLTICVMVRESDVYSRRDCEELREGGNGMLPTEPDADAPGADWMSKLPYTAHDGRLGRFVADDRVEMVVPVHPLYVAEENTITMHVRGGTVARVECGHDFVGCVPRDGYYKPIPPFTFETKPNGDIRVQVFPDRLDTVQYDFAVFFADGGVAHKTLKTDVEFGTKQPRAINQSCGNDSHQFPNHPVHLVAPAAQEPARPTNDLWSSACFDGIPSFVVIPPKLMTFRVWNDDSEPAIKVDSSTGQVTPLHPGQALLEREFRGLKSETCFVVDAKGEPFFRDVSNCRALRAKYGAPLPPVPPLETSGPQALSTMAEVRLDQVIERATLSPDVKDKFVADERIQIPLEGVSLPLGEPDTLTVHLTGPKVLQTIVYQKVIRISSSEPQEPYEYEDMETSVGGPIGTVIGSIETSPDGSTYVKVVAQRLGKAKFSIHVLFADGGVATRTFEVPVRLPQNPPLQLTNAENGTAIDYLESQATTLHLLPTPPDNVRRLLPVVRYQWRVLLNASDVKFEVRQPREPVIRLDETTGEVAALGVGHALIEMSFAGAKSETCVVVMEDLIKGDPSNCEELRGQRWLENMFRSQN